MRSPQSGSACEPTGDKHAQTLRSASESRLAAARALMLSIAPPKGHELPEELFLRYLLSVTSANDRPPPSRGAQEAPQGRC